MMRFFLRYSSVAMLLAGSLAAQANESEGPVYQRSRHGGQPSYGTHWGDGVGNYHPGYSRYGHGYYGQPSSGNWFVRPYPYHFDYYKWRVSTPPVAQDCPCANQGQQHQILNP